jgi:phage tail sheath protein FI
MNPEPTTSKRLRALSREVMSLVRAHAPPWTDQNDSDPGLTLIQLLTWLADALTASADQATGVAALDAQRKLGQIVRHVLSSDSSVVTVDGIAWQPASPGSSEEVGERTYVLEADEGGAARIRFGEGERGARPPAGSEVTVTYRSPDRAALTVTVPWPPASRSVVLGLDESEATFGGAGNASRTISGVPTSITAFVGRAAFGRFNDPVPVRTFAEYEREFGGLSLESTLSYAVHQYFLNGGSEALIVRVSDAPDGTASTDSEIAGIGLEAAQEGLWALEKADLFNILCIPPLSRTKDLDPIATLKPALAYCRARRAMLIVDPPSTWNTPAEVLDPNTGLDSLGLTGEDASNAALYFPRVRLPDPLNGNQPTAFPPCGMVAAIYARTDAQHSVWTTPAGSDAILLGSAEPVYPLSNAENGMLNPRAVNGIRMFPPETVVIWGGRTLAGADTQASDWKYVAVRRLALYIEESLLRGTRWASFEPNDEPLWAQVRMTVGDFMHGLFSRGAFQGAVSREAYFVRCDRETMTQDDIETGRLIILVGFAPLKPAEFVIIRIQQEHADQ